MTRALALELAELNIRVNAVAPGAIMTGEHHRRRSPNDPRYKEWLKRMMGSTHPLHLPPDDPRRVEWMKRMPAGRMGLPRDIAAAVAFLASPDADYITGEILYVDGGITAQLSPRTTPL
jgi:NAD(P)-dependent dehydrogenase (short-subunit alcohol dehydrogenase family)